MAVAVPNPPKDPKLEPPIEEVGAVDPKPKADVEAAGVAPNPVLVPNPKLFDGVLNVLVVDVAAGAPNPVAAGAPKPVPVPNAVVCC